MYACWFLWRVNYIEVFKWCPHLQFGVTFWRVVLREVYFEEPNCIWRALKGSILKTGYLPPPPPVSLICSTCFPTTQGHTVIHTHCIPSPLVFPARVTPTWEPLTAVLGRPVVTTKAHGNTDTSTFLPSSVALPARHGYAVCKLRFRRQ